MSQARDEILQRLRINCTECSLGLPLSHGAYGSVRWAMVDGMECVAKCAKPKMAGADAFLRAEAEINAQLREAAPADDTHLAPFLGSASVAGCPYLVWRACPGVHGTLSRFLEPPQLPRLARALGTVPHDHDANLTPDEHAVLARTLLRELLSALLVVHGCGVVSRDVKPDNILVDDECHGLRLIDFGAACAVGQPGARCAGTAAYMPPEGAVTPAAPGAYDIYSAALVWLRVVVPELAPRAALEEFRQALRRFGEEERGASASGGADATHARLEAWLLPWLMADAGGWDDAEARRAAPVLARMLAASPEERCSAAEALAHRYLSSPTDTRRWMM